MARFNPHEESAEAVYAAAETWLDTCLLGDGSIFSSNNNLWTKELLDELDERFVQNLDAGEGDFFEKLEAQLSGGSPQCKQLMSELHWLILLFASRISEPKKRKDVQLIWSWSGETLPEDQPMLSDATLGGLGHTGTAYNTHRWREFVFAINALREFKTKPPEEQTQLASSSWDFARWLTSVSDGENRQFRHILANLLFPDDFERISTVRDKHAILAAFEDVPVKDVQKRDLVEIDQSLKELRQSLEGELGKPIDFYMEGVVERWKPSPDAVVTPPMKADARNGDDGSVKRPASRSLNTILYGPPGTGKTYETAKRAVLICDGHAPTKREDVMKRYDELYQERRIEFVTFHQSYSYEEFIEGLRPETGNDDDADGVQSAGFRLVARPGVLKRIAERARQRPAKANTQADYSDRRIFKVSLGRAWDPEDEDIRTEAYEKGLVSLGYGGKIDWSDPKFGSYNAVYDRWREEPGEEEATGKNPNIEMLNQLRNNMRPGDIVIASQGNKRVRAVGVVSGPYKFDPDVRHHHRREVEWRWQADDDSGIEVEDIYASNFSQQSIYQLFPNKINWPNLLAYLEPATTDAPHPPHVLIIDEINRANISKVLGELITLLEEDKRASALNELTVTLPYSGDRFTLPPNLHIVGTMNTADRSIALLDTALRRRFRFEELPPKPEILSDIVVEDIGLDSVLEAINKRLEWYLGADHLIGHGYFTSVESLEQLDEVIANKIIPLLREYFHEDLGRVRAILGGGNAFLRRERISSPPGVDDAYEDERFRYVDNYLELGQYGREAYEELISSVQQQTG
ncbi:AAA family ATPase [Ruegeria profundi]|uniref:ATPase dynein-related AAA domain-containing protein n=1 Tax=Ruegeria profundi TaxID=1685378 RepID=A0A0X3TPY8_9RHOB|nr:AAA family ATPase [Ruegeria profundi]KUJ77773.1 hypothetical protein AVO44_15710 [Ruegeria profundi]